MITAYLYKKEIAFVFFDRVSSLFVIFPISKISKAINATTGEKNVIAYNSQNRE